MHWARFSLTTALLLTSIGGCGSRPAPGRTAAKRPQQEAPANLLQVQGTVTLDGMPLSEGMVMFLPLKEQEGRPASGLIESGGLFTLSTVMTGDGVVPGSYKVVVTQPGAGATAKQRIPMLYTDLEKTPLQCTVEKEGQQISLELKS
jgi:hypothetical protein